MNASGISFARAHSELGWPTPAEILQPPGSGASIFARLVEHKIGRAVSRSGGTDVTIGVLMADPHSERTEPPIAIGVEFNRPVNESTLRELHRLAWNFSHVPILITLEPELLRVWSCCEAPDPNRSLEQFVVHQLHDLACDNTNSSTQQEAAAQALHWINLVSGTFFNERADRFDRNGRADQMLLGNLRYIRERLAQAGLTDDDVCHDLLARTILVQFLFDRKDSEGAAALNRSKLQRLHAEGILARDHDNFSSILSSYTDTYRLFDWLNDRFNGDLFPGKGGTPAARDVGWRKEKRVVSRQHLQILSEFISGTLDMPSGQRCLWPQYSFDVIPLEFISCIYETFVTVRAKKNGIFYTPPHLVDFVLDRVLPWSGSQWDLKILDPACGSGIFLVKAFQRLVHRWKQANPGQGIRAEILRRLLERNLFGVDKDPHAVRVACFSLYLAMCDEVDPRHYWTQIIFPAMRERRLVCSDFFAENIIGFDTASDADSYDLVVGNAPWGDSVVTAAAVRWAAESEWPVANRDIGGLFLAKAARLVRNDGRIAMIQSANALLFNSSNRAYSFRRRLFAIHSVDEIYNLAALRFKVFAGKAHATKTSVAPACVVIMRSDKPSADDRVAYITPKRLKPLVDEFTIVIEPMDRKWIAVREAADATVWKCLMWGGPRDRALMQRLQQSGSLDTAIREGSIKTREGVIPGDQTRLIPELSGRRWFEGSTFPEGSLLTLCADDLPPARNLRVHSRESTDYSAFAYPQLLIKQSWQKASGRFSARLVESSSREAVVCSQSFLSATGPYELLEAACFAFNSKLAVYFLQLSSGRVAAYRPEAQVSDLLKVPIPMPRPGLSKEMRSLDDIDRHVYEACSLKDAERVLVEDMIAYALADFRGGADSRDRLPVPESLQGDGTEKILRDYCTYFIRVLTAGFGADRPVTARIFQQVSGKRLPYRLVAFELAGKGQEVKVESIQSSALLKEIERLDYGQDRRRRGIYHERVARIYDNASGNPAIYILKPDSSRYWTRSTGLQDADEVALDLFHWLNSAQEGVAIG